MIFFFIGLGTAWEDTKFSLKCSGLEMEHSKLNAGSTFEKWVIKIVAKNGVEILVLSGRINIS